jgi:hypothetical protein
MINRVWLRRFFDNAALLVSVPALFRWPGIGDFFPRNRGRFRPWRPLRFCLRR